MKYKIYSNLCIPPVSGISNFKGSEEYLCDNVLELIEFIEKQVNSVDFIEMIKIYKDYARDCVEDFNPKHFYVNCLEGDEWYDDFNEGIFAIYNIQIDPEEKGMTFLYFYVEIVDCGDSYFVNVKPFLHDGPFNEEKHRETKNEELLYRYFYINGLTRIIKKG